MFSVGGVEVGRYVLDDAFKPYMHPLKSLLGHTVSLAVPHDHRHHKGLMYALATEDVNFWEETPTQEYPINGRQSQQHVSATASDGCAAISQRLIWSAVDGSLETFDELREISCRTDGESVRWTWKSHLLALRDLRLRQSQWSAVKPDGGLISYHGLGIRFPRSFGAMSTATRFRQNDEDVALSDALGARTRSSEVCDQLDGAWPPPKVAVRIEQLGTSDAFFVMRDPFAYLSVGPSNASPLDLCKGQSLDRTYIVEVRDCT